MVPVGALDDWFIVVDGIPAQKDLFFQRKKYIFCLICVKKSQKTVDFFRHHNSNTRHFVKNGFRAMKICSESLNVVLVRSVYGIG